MATKYNYKKSYLGKILSTGVGNVVGVSLIGATSGMVNELPIGTTKTIAGIIPGLQATTLVGHNLKIAKQSFKWKGGKYGK